MCVCVCLCFDVRIFYVFYVCDVQLYSAIGQHDMTRSKGLVQAILSIPGIDLNAQITHGSLRMPPLMWLVQANPHAAKKHVRELMTMLIEAKADPNVRDSTNVSVDLLMVRFQLCFAAVRCCRMLLFFLLLFCCPLVACFIRFFISHC